MPNAAQDQDHYVRNARRTEHDSQSEPLLGEQQVQNNAGGFVYELDKWGRLRRWLILGAEGGTYYVKEKTLTQDNAKVILECLREDPLRTINTIVEVSEAGCAPKQAPAIFALALAASYGPRGNPSPEDRVTRTLAMQMVPRVCRIGTDLFAFIDAVTKFRGWGTGLRKNVATWYTSKTADQAAFQMVKYQQRNGRSHKDVLKQCHVKTDDQKLQAAIRWAITGGLDNMGARLLVDRDRPDAKREYASIDLSVLPEIIEGFEQLKGVKDAKTAANLVSSYKLPREAVPTQFLNDPVVQEALIPHMGIGALVRSLGPFSASGLLSPFSDASKLVCAKLSDVEAIRKSRVHPMNVLVGLRTYSQGHGDKGKLKWTSVPQIVEACDGAFYMAFPNVEPANKNTIIGLDVSGSMSSLCGGLPLTCAEAAAAMAMVIVRTEPAYLILAFAGKLMPLTITKKDSLSDVLTKTRGINFGSTDCSLPILAAIDCDWKAESFITITDNETWSGTMHPSEALRKFRAKSGIEAKLAVLGMTASAFTIADPKDAGMMDFVGMDTSVPVVMNDFLRG